MTLRASGWNGPIGTVFGLRVQRFEKKEEGKVLVWDRLEFKELRLSRPAALLVVQGLSLNHLFPPDAAFCVGDTKHPELVFNAPMLLLQRNAQVFSNPPKLLDVALGAVIFTKDYEEDDIRSEMLKSVLSP